jgi:outer membrane biosynthesis protein TonB
VLRQEMGGLMYWSRWISRLIGLAVPAAAVVLLLTFSAVSLSAQESRKLIAQPAPVYPEMAKKFALTGVVKVQVVIAPDGHIKDMKFIGGHPLLVATVEDTLKHWRYAPASGESTDVLEFNFHP